MKRLSCSDSLGAVLYTHKEKNHPEDNCDYSREFEEMLDGLEYEESMEEIGQGMEKKRRLRNDQVKALERIFEVDNKLDPERKMKLAQELGLQPRQVSIWFQNRRARRKTKQLERDYGHLKANYEALKLNYSKLEEERQNFNSELKELKSKLGEEKTESNEIDKENTLFLNSPIRPCIELQPNNNINLVETKRLVDFNDNNFNPNLDFSSFSLSPPLPLLSSNYTEFLDSRAVLTKSYHQVVKVEEKCVYGSEESCNIFSVDQAPTLCWYFPDQRS